MSARLLLGDCRDSMQAMDAESIDAIVSDPPYGLSFMGKGWDHGVPGEDFWVEALRVAKPGAHLLAFGGTRTFHRLVVAIEDAGWEIRDCLMWVYGSGFPKSLDVSKAIDKIDKIGPMEARARTFTAWMRSTGITAAQINEATGSFMGSHYLTDKQQPAVATADLFDLLRPLLPAVPADIEELVRSRTVESENMKRRAVVGHRDMGFAPGTNEVFGKFSGDTRITEPHTEAAKRWAGWGTALKPAYEPIIMARKPLTGTVAANVLRHGTGAINVDGCRVGAGFGAWKGGGSALYNGGLSRDGGLARPVLGRWPANVLHDGSDEVTGLFPTTTSGGTPFSRPSGMGYHGATGQDDVAGNRGDSGSAARFFYCAKASKTDRDDGCDGLDAHKQDETRNEGDPGGNNPRNRGANERSNHHPTVKPTDLMRYLCRLVTPPGGTVLDPFMGSGSTGKAATLEGFSFVGCELQPEYMAIAEARIRHAEGEVEPLLRVRS